MKMLKPQTYFKQYNKIVYCMFSSFISVLSIYILLSFVGSEKNIMWLVLFLLLTLLYKKALNINIKKECKVIAIIIATLFSLFFFVGFELSHHSTLTNIFVPNTFNSVSKVIGIIETLICFLGLAMIFHAFIVIIFDLCCKFNLCTTKKPQAIWFTSSLYSFFIIWVVIFVCWLPYLIIYYPGNFTSDSISQFLQGLGMISFNAHHTILHTLIMALFIRIGDTLGSHNLGAGLYNITQMLIMSSIFSYVLKYLAYRNVRTSIRFLYLAYFALYPVNALYSITGWKDVIFGGLCLLLLIIITEVIRQPKTILENNLYLIIIYLVTVLFILFRNNAVYAIILFLPFFLFKMRKYWKRIVPLVLACGITVFAFNWCAYNIFNVKEPSVTEALSIPLQQIARTVTEHNYELLVEEIDVLSRYFNIDELPLLYNPRLSDPVKWSGFYVNSFHEDTSGFFKIWLELGLKYPMTYISSFLMNSYGYWYPGVDYWVYSIGVVDYSNSFLQINSADKFPKIGRTVASLIRIVHKVPVLSMISSIGFMVWLIIISIGIAIGKSSKDIIIPILLPGFIWLTTLASPVFAEYRYVYSIMLCAPLIFILSNITEPS